MTTDELRALTDRLTGCVNESEFQGKEAGHLLVESVGGRIDAEKGTAAAEVHVTYDQAGPWNHPAKRAAKGHKGVPKVEYQAAAFPPEADDLKYVVTEKGEE